MAVRGDLRFDRVQVGGSHSCGRTTDGATFCWGYNLEGQLGDGTLAHRTEPQRVTARAEETG